MGNQIQHTQQYQTNAHKGHMLHTFWQDGQEVIARREITGQHPTRMMQSQQSQMGAEDAY